MERRFLCSTTTLSSPLKASRLGHTIDFASLFYLINVHKYRG